MIRFDLICENEHEFDGWFDSNSAFENQCEKGYVGCPVCQSDKVNKQLMAPGIPEKSNKLAKSDHTREVFSAGISSETAEIKKKIRQLRDHISQNAENVGDDFANTARKIHYQEQEARPIYGQASFDDAKALLEEGVEVLPLPQLPEEKN